MATKDKVYVGDINVGSASTTTGTSTIYSTNPSYSAEKGWECPRCGRINAPWVRQCDCSRNNWTITTSDWTYKPEWWKEVTCNGTSSQVQLDSDTFRIHPESDPKYQVGGSDYKEGHTYVNVNGTQSNKIEPDVTTWSYTNPDNCYTPHYTTETVVTGGIHNFYHLKTPKETK